MGLRRRQVLPHPGPPGHHAKAGETEADDAEETAPVLLTGQPASPGVGIGTRPRRATTPTTSTSSKPGDILVAEMTTPDFVPAMKRAAAIMTERGGRTCHAAIVSRELGIPCVVGAGGATSTRRRAEKSPSMARAGNVYEGRAEARLAWAERQKERYAQAAQLKTTTKLYVNLAEPELAERIAAAPRRWRRPAARRVHRRADWRPPAPVHRRRPAGGVHAAARRRHPRVLPRLRTRARWSTA